MAKKTVEYTSLTDICKGKDMDYFNSQEFEFSFGSPNEHTLVKASAILEDFDDDAPKALVNKLENLGDSLVDVES